MMSNRKVSIPSYLFLCLIIFSSNLYGKGTLRVTQSDNFWHLQLNVAVLDLFDLEKKTSSQKLLAHIKSKVALLNTPSAIVVIPQQCHVTQQEVFIPEEYRFGKKYSGKKNAGDSIDIDKTLSNYEQTDAEVTLMFNCIDEIKQLKFKLFETFPNFYAVDLDWKVNFGSGETKLTPLNSIVYFFKSETLEG